MIARITNKVIKQITYVGSVIQGARIDLDAKEILETCTPPEIFDTGKCIMFVVGVVALVVSETMSVARYIIKDF